MNELILIPLQVVWGIAVCVAWILAVLYAVMIINERKNALMKDWVFLIVGIAFATTPFLFEGIACDKYVIGKDGMLVKILRPQIMTQHSYNRLTSESTVISHMKFYNDQQLIVSFRTNITVEINYQYDYHEDLTEIYILIARESARKKVDPSAALQGIVLSEATGQLKALEEKFSSLSQNPSYKTLQMDRAFVTASTLRELKPMMDKYHIYPQLITVRWNE